MRARGEVNPRKKLLAPVLICVLFAGLLFVYYGTFFKPRLQKGASGIDTSADAAALAKYSRKLGSSGEEDESQVNNFNILNDGDEKSGEARIGGGEVFSEERNDTIPKTFPVCDSKLSELIPCLDRNLIYQLKMKLDLGLMEHYERHCPPQERRYNCLIPPPQGYKVPIPWPASRDEVWKVNIPHTHLANEKSDQNWMVVNEDKINFPGGGTHFHNGADKYIAALARMLKFPLENLSNAGKLRTVLDVGCGVASFGAYLLPLEIMAMSLAPNDVHQNQIQFALERGIPSTLGVLGTMRLPYPSRSFELAHCSRCRIDWLQRDGILLLELDRVLRPGGYFAYSSPEAYMQDEEDLQIWHAMSDLVKRMCWKIAAKRDQTVIWQKPLTNSCYLKRAPDTKPPLCSPDDDPDAVWQVRMKACITPYSDQMHHAKGSGLVPWPKRLTASPPRLEDLGISEGDFKKDTVMNVVLENGPNTLKVVYDRGLLGSVHNWCEAFSTYPRTYDLLHAWTVFSDISEKDCSIEDLLIEMDRIVRPKSLCDYQRQAFNNKLHQELFASLAVGFMDVVC
ncbi:hypothetical protein KI387_027944 [Taxus chinensis]|uniref:Methyltransferase n=1 Tax=Taxus chinensis TaxID=29808 RepID=A0AA38FYN3_TAXCH|nr:hypothetical protein KI387_027944 [Taxus chinensis]